MPGFAISAGSPLSSMPSVETARKPEPFWDAVGAGVEDATQTRNTGARREALRAAAWKRHRAIETALGRQIERSDFLLGVDEDSNSLNRGDTERMTPGERVAQSFGLRQVKPAPTQDAYEAMLDELRAQNPKAFEGIETFAQMRDRLSGELGAVRRRADEAAEDRPVATFLGQAAGAMTDPLNALSVMQGGAARTFAGRILESGLQNTVAEGFQIPLRMDDAKVAGPAYTADEAKGDLAGAAVGGMAFQGLFEGGFRVARAGLRAVRPVVEGPAERRAVDVLEQGLRDDAAVGGLTGREYDEATTALDAGAPPPRFEPDRDLTELFSPRGADGGSGEVVNYKGRPIAATSFDPATLTTDPARFQYKAGGDAEGVTARLRGVEAWDPLAAGRALIWEDRSGVRYVADGHQRFGLIRRLNDERGFENQLDGYLFREVDGWSAADLRVMGALKNIREGSGSPMDAAKVFRERPEALGDRSLPVTGDFMAQARGLASLSDGAFKAAVNRVIDERYAAEIGRNAADRPELHDDMVRLIKQADPANVDEARALVVEALQDDWIKSEGTEQDLFGYDPSFSAMIGRAKVAAAVKRALARDARLFNQLVKNADAIEAGGNALARDANQARLAVDRAALEMAAKLALRHGPIGEAMAEAAAKVTKGENAATAAKPVLARLRAALEAGERLDDLRGVALDPKPPAAASEALAAKFDDPAGEGAKAQAEPAPEDAEFEAEPGGLFDDLFRESGKAEKARSALAACVPGGGGE